MRTHSPSKATSHDQLPGPMRTSIMLQLEAWHRIILQASLLLAGFVIRPPNVFLTPDTDHGSFNTARLC